VHAALAIAKADGRVQRALDGIFLLRFYLRLRPHVTQIPRLPDETERPAAKFDRHEMIDGVVRPQLVRNSILAEHRGAIATPFCIVAVPHCARVTPHANSGDAERGTVDRAYGAGR